MDRIEQLDLKIMRYQPLAPSSWLPLPTELENSRSLINVENTKDHLCAVWAILASLHHQEVGDPKDPVCYERWLKTFTMHNVEFPLKLNDISRLESGNQLRINLFGWDSEKAELFPVYISKVRQAVPLVELLYYDNLNNQSHYVAITNFNGLASRVRGGEQNSSSWRHFCRRCMVGFRTRKRLEKHGIDCDQFKPQCIRYPDPNNQEQCWLRFKNYHYQHRLSHVIYADFESLLLPISTVAPDPATSYTIRVQQHKMFAYAMIMVGPDGKSIKSDLYTDEKDAMKTFVVTLFEWEKEIGKAKSEANIGMPADWKAPASITDCFICGLPLEANLLVDPVVRDHDHYSGQVRI